jgi:5-methylcytosine-specific restriction endonuclease McrA
MLRRVDNATIAHDHGVLTGRGWVTFTVGRRSVRVGRKIHRRDFEAAVEAQRTYPVYVTTIDGRNYWHYDDRFYSDNEGLVAAEVYALLLTRKQREQRKVDRALATVNMETRPAPRDRPRIPDDVMRYVMVRDGGQCQSCGSNAEIQFDHVIPWSMGGSSEPENLQLLCGPCNRTKGGGLTLRRS